MRRIALVTDFGTRDPYVAAVKGVIAARTNAPLPDLSHDIEPFDVFQVAWFLRAILRFWTADTIFRIVVDPGVGTSRRILALESDGRIFLAPDNGALTFLEGRVYSVENESLFLPGGSTTFHGRDRFAPVAAALANGLSINELGRRISDPVRLEYTPPCYSAGRVTGTIVAIDRFGNAITDIEAARLPFSTFEVRAGQTKITRRSNTYSGSEPFTIVGSTGCIEISKAGEGAATLLHLRRGDPLVIVPA